ncbi:MAG: 2-hydroxyacyl-CoA dehydratase family protein [Dehalococcoidia bacterium]
MDAMKKLSEHLTRRRPELREIKKSGQRIIGYSPGGYFPEEIARATGALPICLARGGDPEAVSESLAYIPRFVDTFCRCQIGYRVMGEEVLYQLPDLIIVPVNDINQRAIADCWSYYTDVETFRYGVPHNKRQDAYEYFLGSLHLLKEKLENFTGTSITDARLKEEIKKQNEMRELFRNIDSLREPGKTPVISSWEFTRLHHASFWADREVFMQILKELYEELKQKQVENTDKPKIMLTASTLAMGDYKIFDIMDEIGGEIIFEEAAEGLRHYDHDVPLDGDPMTALADTYFLKRLPPAWFRPCRERVDYLINTCKERRAEGMLWYQLLYRDGYDIQSYSFEKEFEQTTGLPFLKIESDYDTSERGQFKTRMETFLEIIKQRRK